MGPTIAAQTYSKCNMEAPESRQNGLCVPAGESRLG